WAIRSGLAPLRMLSAELSQTVPRSRPIHLSGRALPGEIVPLVAAVDDAFGRLHAAYEAHRRFAANAAPELRTPLPILQSGLERMPKDETTRSLQEDIARMSRIVAQLLELARIESGPATISGSVELAKLVTEVAAAVGSLAYERNVSVSLQSQAPVINVRGTMGLLGAIVRNLLENAILYTRPGTEVSLSLSASGLLAIDDRGPGIPTQERNRIFDRFWRGSQTGANGSGLGLAIVKEVADRIGATIEVKARARGGARFCVQFATGVVLAPHTNRGARRTARLRFAFDKRRFRNGCRHFSVKARVFENYLNKLGPRCSQTRGLGPLGKQGNYVVWQ